MARVGDYYSRARAPTLVHFGGSWGPCAGRMLQHGGAAAAGLPARPHSREVASAAGPARGPSAGPAAGDVRMRRELSPGQ